MQMRAGIRQDRCIPATAIDEIVALRLRVGLLPDGGALSG
jgi:hypothetical protein